MSTSDHCFVCQKSFKRLFAHLAQSAVCKSHYMLAHDGDKAPPAATLPTITVHDNVYTSNVSQGASRHTRLNLCWSSSSHARESGAVVGEDDELRVEDVNEVDDDFVVDDDGFPDGDADDQDVSETEEEEGPDLSVLDLYLKLFQLRCKPSWSCAFFSGGEGSN